jgi:hypothetical protein
MAHYDNIKGKSIEGLLRDLLDSGYNLETSTELIAVIQSRNTETLNTSLRGLSSNIATASTESSSLGKKIVLLTYALVTVGIGQIIATAWPYIAWWWHH